MKIDEKECVGYSNCPPCGSMGCMTMDEGADGAKIDEDVHVKLEFASDQKHTPLHSRECGILNASRAAETLGETAFK